MKTNCKHEGKNDCKILNKMNCENCKFMQTETDVKNSNAKARERLASLPKEEQLYISGKYYKGGMPWWRK